MSDAFLIKNFSERGVELDWIQANDVFMRLGC